MVEHYIYSYLWDHLKQNTGNIADCVVSEEEGCRRRNAHWFTSILGTGNVSKNFMYASYTSLHFRCNR